MDSRDLAYSSREALAYGGYPQHPATDFKPPLNDHKPPILQLEQLQLENSQKPPPLPPKIPHENSQDSQSHFPQPSSGQYTAQVADTSPYFHQPYTPTDIGPESPPPPLPARPTPPVETTPASIHHAIYPPPQHGHQSPSPFSPIGNAPSPYPIHTQNSPPPQNSHISSITPPHPFSPTNVPYPPYATSIPMTPQYSNGFVPPHPAAPYSSPTSPTASIPMSHSVSHPGSPIGGHPVGGFGVADMGSLSLVQHSLSQQSHSATSQTAHAPPMPVNPQFAAQASDQAQVADQMPRMRIRHDAKCAGCGCYPIRGDYRWHCLTCPNENLCSQCMDAGMKSSHKFKPVTLWTAVHPGKYCWGCKADPIVGVRSRCKTHYGEDWCEECIGSGRCCKGPFVEYDTSDLGKYIEQYGGVPMPPEWLPYLQGPPVETYYLTRDKSQENWLSMEGKRKFIRKMDRDNALSSKKPAVSSYSYDPIFDKHTFSDSKYRFAFKGLPRSGDELDRKDKLWHYMIRYTNRGWVTHQEFASHQSDECIPGGAPTFRHGPECDSLVFTAPIDPRHPGHSHTREFRWLTNRPVSALNEDRWDAQHYALFERIPDDPRNNSYPNIHHPHQQHQQSYHERIVADMAWWDRQHDMPAATVRVRDASVDHGIVLATLSVLHAHQWRLMAKERELCPEDFKRAEKVARTTHLGRLAYWQHDDDKILAGGARKGGAGTGEKAEGGSLIKRATLMNLAGLEVAANVLELANKLAE